MDALRLKAFGPGPGPDYDPALPAPRSAARVEQARIRHLEAHLARLRASAMAQGRDQPWIEGLATELAAWVGTVTRGEREALRLRLLGARVWALLEPIPVVAQPYHLKLMPHPLGSPLPLAPHKGLLGLWNAAPLREAQVQGAEDALLHWPDGALVETAIASITLEVGGELWLPPMEGRVASLAERLDLPEWAGARTRRFHAFHAQDLRRGQLWCFNAVRGIWPATLL